MNADFHVTGHGSLYLVQPLTEAASLWLGEHIGEEAQWFGGALAVEHRYIRPLVEGIVNDGYTIKATILARWNGLKASDER